MTLLTAAAVLALAASCQHTFAPKTILAVAQGESATLTAELDPRVIHVNKDGTADYGLMQINSANFKWLGLTPQSALDPCRSIAAAETVLKTMSGYNTGSPTRGLGYALAVTKRERGSQPNFIPATSPAARQDEVDIEDRPAVTDGDVIFNGD